MKGVHARWAALFATLVLAGHATADEGRWTKRAREGKEIFAVLKTNHGEIGLRLFSADAPKTVQNFVGLAAGEKDFTDPASGKLERRPFYDGTIFHRVIPDFMIQGGDPLGAGHGGPGYAFEDEFQSGRRFDKVGLLAMANRGPNTNGSQFFLTTSLPAYLNNRHTIFGEVVSGYDVVEKISRLPRDSADRPQTDVVIAKVELRESPPPSAEAAKQEKRLEEKKGEKKPDTKDHSKKSANKRAKRKS